MGDDPFKLAKKLLKGNGEVQLQPVDDKEVDDLVKSLLANINTKPAAEAKDEDNQKGSGEEDTKKLNPAEAKEHYIKGQKFAKAAVTADNQSLWGTAAKMYDQCLVSFAEALECGFPQAPDKIELLVKKMATYLDRLQTLIVHSETKNFSMDACTDKIPAINALNKRRRAVLSSMTRNGKFQSLSRAMDLRKRAMAAEGDAQTWEAFVLYSEALDCFMAYLQNMKDKNSNMRQPILEAIDKTLTAAEKLKSELQES